jgi:hypothetical protein
VPAIDRDLAGDQQGSPVVAIVDDLEQIAALLGVERWFARPSLTETCTLYSLPVSRRTHCQFKRGWYPPAVGGRCREVLGTPIGLPPSQESGAKKVDSTELR